MPIEALAAVSLLGNILQFVEAGAKVLSKAKQIHDSTDGLSNDILNLTTVINELESYNDRLKDTLCPPGTCVVYTAADASLENLRAQCCSVNIELRNVLSSLAVDGKNTKWKSFKKALANEWKSGKLKSIQSSLFALREEMQFQVTFSLKENVDLLALQQTEAFRRLDASTQAVVDAAVENRLEILDVLCKHTLDLQAAQLQAMEGAMDALRENMTSMEGHIGAKIEVNQEQIQHDINRAAQVILEQESVEHQATRSAAELQVVALGNRIEAEGKGTRTLVVSSNHQMMLAMDRIVDQVQTLSDRVRAQALEHEQVKGWIAALLAQQAQVIEAQAAAMKAANKSATKTSSKTLRKALRKAQEGLRAALELLIALAEIFEREVGIQYHTVREVISRNMGSVDAASFLSYLRRQPREYDLHKEALPADSMRVSAEPQTLSVAPSYVLTDAADPEIESAFLQFFDLVLGGSSHRDAIEIDVAVTSRTWDMAHMSISWSVASTGPFWQMDREFLQGLTLPDWHKFQHQKWIFAYYGGKLHVVETTNATDDTLFDVISSSLDYPGRIYPSLAKFKWTSIVGEGRLVDFVVWCNPWALSSPDENIPEYYRYVRPLDVVNNEPYNISTIRSEISTIDTTPFYLTEYGQPIRHTLPQVVWGLLVSSWVYDGEGLDGITINIHWDIKNPERFDNDGASGQR